MSIFGALDANEIPVNPYWVEAGEYRALITNAYFKHDKENNKHQLVINYTISDENSAYFNNEVRDWFDYYPEITKELLDALEPAEKRKVKGALSAIKRRLCGIPEQGFIGLGVDPKELEDKEDLWDPTSLVGKEVDLIVTNNGANNEFTNVRAANLV